MNVQSYLKQRNIDFNVIEHEPTYTAQSLAAVVHVSGKRVAKSVMMKADDGYLLVILPADRSVDVDAVRETIGAGHVELAMESECGHEFTDCEFGARLPFGSQYGMRTLMDDSLMQDEEIIFEGNRHNEAIRMKLEDFRRLEEPVVAAVSHPW